ncbi:hypothetical protein RRG08_048605 [Elysia crispata]|uniref:Uncharacterized protein n=1 Tax=Elysia crispata TaxID=231223 RepID=A0AAE1ACT3_9GAST|nr:hypothetical protein RRG08_048605 [Elysia crispata]
MDYRAAGLFLTFDITKQIPSLHPHCPLVIKWPEVTNVVYLALPKAEWDGWLRSVSTLGFDRGTSLVGEQGRGRRLYNTELASHARADSWVGYSC